MPNQTLLFDEDFIADCREAALPDGADEMVRCYGCKKIWPASEISGGLCGECADPIKEDDDEDVNLPKAKGPRSAKAGEEKLGTGLAPACDHTLAPVAAACQGLKGFYTLANTKKKVGAGWARTSQDGKTKYVSLVISGGLDPDIYLVMFQNSFKEKDDQPDFIVYLNPPRPAAGAAAASAAKPAATATAEDFPDDGGGDDNIPF